MPAHDKSFLSVACFFLVCSLCACAPGYHPGAKINGVRVPSRALAFQTTQMKAAVIPPPGVIFTKSSAPLGAAPPKRAMGSRQGRSVAHSIGLPPLPIRGFTGGFNLFTWGDATVSASQADGEITTPSHSEYESMVLLMIYRRMTVTTSAASRGSRLNAIDGFCE